MCANSPSAGMWDRVKYEDAEKEMYTYTIVTTDSNKQLRFLHDRMPVILANGSKEMWTWLDSERKQWSNELQQSLRPFEGELECYPVSKVRTRSLVAAQPNCACYTGDLDSKAC